MHRRMLSNGWTKYAKTLFGREGGQGGRTEDDGEFVEEEGKWMA